jgi:stage II sporulation protein P
MFGKKRNRLLKATNVSDFSFRKVIFRFYLILSSIILLISIFSLPSFQYRILHFESIERISYSDDVTNAILLGMSTEIPQLESTLDAEMPSISKLAFSLATGINATDFASYLGKELPGFEAYNTKIYVAGIGSDYTNLPMESPPPNFEELLEDYDEEDIQNPEEPSEPTPEPVNPSVFIYHSHSWEAFNPLMEEVNTNVSSIDTDENIVLVGSMLANELNEYGIETLHDQTNIAKELRDNGMTWTDSYEYTRDLVTQAASNNQNINYFIDVHRDAASKDVTTMEIEGKSYARLYFVVGEENKNYKQNLKFVEALNAALEKEYPGISRGIYLKDRYEGNGVYNQDVSDKAILIEVGGVDNTKEELTNTVEAFAKVFQELYDGTIEVNTQ